MRVARPNANDLAAFMRIDRLKQASIAALNRRCGRCVTRNDVIDMRIDMAAASNRFRRQWSRKRRTTFKPYSTQYNARNTRTAQPSGDAEPDLRVPPPRTRQIRIQALTQSTPSNRCRQTATLRSRFDGSRYRRADADTIERMCFLRGQSGKPGALPGTFRMASAVLAASRFLAINPWSPASNRQRR